MPPAIVETSDNEATNSSMLSSEHNNKRTIAKATAMSSVYGNKWKLSTANIYVEPQAPSISRRSVSQSVSHLTSK